MVWIGEQETRSRLLSAICGSDLHMYQGRTAAEAGLIFGEIVDSHRAIQLVIFAHPYESIG